MKYVLALILVLICSAANAQICSSVPYIFTPGTTILSAQVNSNFTALISCMNSNAATLGANTDITSLNGLSQTLGILGTTTNNNASAGYLGEYKFVDVPLGSAIAATSAVNFNVTSLSLTAGDWDCNGEVLGSVPGAGGNYTVAIGWINTVSASYGANPELTGITNSGALSAGNGMNLATGTARFSLASTTTVYLSGSFTFTGTASAYGYLRCRRVR